MLKETRGRGKIRRSGPRLRDPPKDRRVPRFVRGALVRGLAQDPAERFASMGHLLEALSKDPARRAARIGIVLVGVGIVAVGVLAFLSERQSRLALAGCDNVGRELVGIWDETHRQDLRRAFEQAIPATAIVDSTAAIQSLDQYANSWTKLRAQACDRAVSAKGDETALLQLSCLANQKTDLQALIDELSRPDPDIAGNARIEMSILQPPSRCTDDRVLVAQPKPPADPKTRAQVYDLRKMLATARVQTLGGKPAKAAEFLGRLVQRASELQYLPLEAEALSALAYSQYYEGDEAHSDETEIKAEDTAEAAGADFVASADAANLAMDAIDSGRLIEGHHWLNRAQALLTRIGGDAETGGLVENAAAELAAAEGRDEDCLDHARQAHALLSKALGENHPRTLNYLGVLGNYYAALHHDEEALPILTKVIKTMTATLGEQSVIPYLANAVSVASRTGRFSEADSYFALGLRLSGDSTRQNTLWYGQLLFAGARLRNTQRRWTDALSMSSRALEIAAHTRGPESGFFAECLVTKGEALEKSGRQLEAKALLTQALEILKRSSAPDSDDPVPALQELARTELSLQHPQKAIPLAEEALARELHHHPYPGQLADLRFTLAQSLASSHRDGPRAALLAEQARAEFAELPWRKAALDEVNDWLSDQAGR